MRCVCIMEVGEGETLTTHGFHISCMSDYISHHRILCISRPMKGKQTTPLNSLCPNIPFIVASYASAGRNCTVHNRIISISWWHLYSLLYKMPAHDFDLDTLKMYLFFYRRETVHFSGGPKYIHLQALLDIILTPWQLYNLKGVQKCFLSNDACKLQCK